MLRLVDFRSRSPADEFVNEVGSKRRMVVRGGISRSPCVLGFGLQIVNPILAFADVHPPSFGALLEDGGAKPSDKKLSTKNDN